MSIENIKTSLDNKPGGTAHDCKPGSLKPDATVAAAASSLNVEAVRSPAQSAGVLPAATGAAGSAAASGSAGSEAAAGSCAGAGVAVADTAGGHAVSGWAARRAGLVEYSIIHGERSMHGAVLTGIEAAKAAHEAAVSGAIDRRCMRGRLSNCGDCPNDIDPHDCQNSPFYVGSGSQCGGNCDCTLNHGASPGESFYGRAARAGEAQYIDPNGDYYKPWLQSYPEGVPEFVNTHEFESLVELFESSVAKYRNHCAFINMDSELTYGQVDELSDSFAAFLQVELGLKQGEKIAIMMPNLMQFPVAFFGALKAGLTVININPLYTPRELRNQLENSDATAIVVIANYADGLASIVHETLVKHVIITEVGDAFNNWLGLKRLIINTAVKLKGMVPAIDRSKFGTCHDFTDALKRGAAVRERFVAPEIKYDDIALLQYTGGTTGRSKGAMLSHGNILANIAQAYGMYGQVLKKGEETILTVIPLYHIFALTVNLVLFTYLGARNLLITDPRNIKSFARDLHRHPEITAMTGVNTLFNMLINNDEFQELKWENLHLVVGGGAALQSGVEQRFFEKTGFHILEGYGLTECSPLCSVCPFDVDHYTGSIGLVVPSTIARIVDSEGREIRDMEQEGELEIKGPQVMHGYYKSERHNDFIFDDGFVRTGDIAKWMEGGYIKLIDRLKDMILVSGFNVFPNEIEDVVSRFNRVLECAVIGIPSDNTGEAVKLFVVRKDQALTAQEVKQYCRAYLTPYKVPRIIQFVDSLPKSSLGKVLRRSLRDMEGKDPKTAEEQILILKAQQEAEAAAAAAAKAAAHDSAHQGSAAAAGERSNVDSRSAWRKASYASGPLGGPQAAQGMVHGADNRGSTVLNAFMSALGRQQAPGTTSIDNEHHLFKNSMSAHSGIRHKSVPGSTVAHLKLTASADGRTYAPQASLSPEQQSRLEQALHGRVTMHVDSAAAPAAPAAAQPSAGAGHASVSDHAASTAPAASVAAEAAPAAAHAAAAAASYEGASGAGSLPKTAGALALERLLSSHGDTMGAAIETPNIHRHQEHLARVDAAHAALHGAAAHKAAATAPSPAPAPADSASKAD